MDATHFGPTVAGQDLVKVLQTEDPRLRRRVCRIYAEYMEGMGQLANIPQATLRRRLYTIWHEDTRARAHTFRQPDVRNFLCNVLRAAFREAMRREKK